MASDIAAHPRAAAGAPGTLERWTQRLVRRRVPISLMLFGGLVLLDLAVIRSRPRDPFDAADPLAIGGVLCVVLGLLVRTWAAGTLRKQRQLARTGPYAWIRHPLYFGSFLMMIGFGTLVHDPLTLWVVAGPVAWLYWLAIQSEERSIAQLFPAEWAAYCRTVPRLLPYRPVRPALGEWSLAQWRKNSEHRAWLGSAAALAGIKLWHLWS
jgi:protein-S-isoprenylcysteine O-methyltransferase Ste14